MFRKELRYYFVTATAYITLGLFWLTVGLFLWTIPGYWNVIDSGYANVNGLFELAPWLLNLLCPALTMRLFAEEKQTGTWEVLLTKPVSAGRIVVDKFLAALTVMLIAIVPCAVHYFITFVLAEPLGNIDGAQFFGSFVGLILLSGSFLALSLLCACFSNNQMIAFIIGATTCFVLHWLVFQSFFESLARGVIDLRDVLFFLSVTVVCLVLTVFKETRKR